MDSVKNGDRVSFKIAKTQYKGVVEVTREGDCDIRSDGGRLLEGVPIRELTLIDGVKMISEAYKPTKIDIAIRNTEVEIANRTRLLSLMEAEIKTLRSQLDMLEKLQRDKTLA